jgi:hypothetical protein
MKRDLSQLSNRQLEQIVMTVCGMGNNWPPQSEWTPAFLEMMAEIQRAALLLKERLGMQ